LGWGQFWIVNGESGEWNKKDEWNKKLVARNSQLTVHHSPFQRLVRHMVREWDERAANGTEIAENAEKGQTNLVSIL